MYKSTQFYMSFVGVQPLVFHSVFYIIVCYLVLFVCNHCIVCCYSIPVFRLPYPYDIFKLFLAIYICDVALLI